MAAPEKQVLPFEGRMRAAGIQPVADDKGEGAGLRISGHPNPRSNKLTGDSGWTSLAYEFDVTDSEHDVIVVCELRSQKGQTLFEEQSLRLVPWAP